jgi:hypothetical protein
MGARCSWAGSQQMGVGGVTGNGRRRRRDSTIGEIGRDKSIDQGRRHEVLSRRRETVARRYWNHGTRRRRVAADGRNWWHWHSVRRSAAARGTGSQQRASIGSVESRDNAKGIVATSITDAKRRRRFVSNGHHGRRCRRSQDNRGRDKGTSRFVASRQKDKSFCGKERIDKERMKGNR